MKKYFLLFLAAIITLDSYSQEIDTAVISENLSPSQLEEVSELLDKNQNNFISQSGNSEEDYEESLKKTDKINISKISANKFGYSYISTSPTSIVASSDLPFPNDYIISLGDTLGVVLSGSKEAIFDMKVQLNGTVFFPELGSIYVVGETFDEVKSKLKNLVSQSYIGVEIDLSLKNLSAKKITLVGTITNPGTYLVNPFTTISNSLAYSGGVSDIGSLREIRLIKPNGDNFIFDLYDLLISGDRSKDLTIDSGDVVLVGAANKFVEISGMVKRPGLYEILPEENLSDLLDFALGFSGGANIGKIVVRTMENNEINTIITSDLNFKLDNVIDVIVYPYEFDSNYAIQVFGAVKEPGAYKFDDSVNTLKKLIEKVEFVDVYPWLAVLEQFDEDNLIKSSILFNLKDSKTYESIDLLPNARIHFASIDNRSFMVSDITKKMIQDYSLRINHKNKQYNLPVYGSYNLNSFIDLLGIDMSDVDEVATYLSPLESIVIRDKYKNMQFDAKKYNVVSFRSPINDLIRVTISGEIDYPGAYILESDSTLADLYSLVGRFKKEAFTKGVIFTRESVRERQLKAIAKSKADLNEAILVSSQKGENIGDINVIRALSQTIEPESLGRIAGDFRPESLSSLNTVLFDGDEIIIPKNPNTINVLGEVLNPIAFEYEKKLNVREAIDKAGGYKEYAKRNSVYVIKANGIIHKANRNIFVRNTKLEPGDTIIVPRKIITNNPGIEALIPVTQILSDIAFSAAALESLSSN